MPENTVYVGRPTIWGNPFAVGKLFENKFPVSNEQAVAFYKKWLPGAMPLSVRQVIKNSLKGKNLACWCALDQPCHADTLLEIANT